MYLFIEPVDVWLFRDGRPFDAASQHRAASLFPPYPTVVQGAIRSHHLVITNTDLNDRQAIVEEVGTSTDYKNLRIRGPFVARAENGKIVRYFPQPADAITVDEDHHTLRSLFPGEADVAETVTNVPTSQLLRLSEEEELKKGETGLWLSEDALKGYLKSKTVTGTPARDLFQREDRLGIGINSTQNVTEEGLLYEVEFVRPKAGAGLALEVTGLNGLDKWPQSGILRLGGEGRGARYRIEKASGDGFQWFSNSNAIANGKPLAQPRFKIYFATPTCFDHGWTPRADPHDWADFFTQPVTLCAAAVHRYESLGGFDMTADPNSDRAHKPAQRYAPAGSVYYFEWQSQAGNLKPNLIQNAITQSRAEIGFGQVFMEVW